MASTMFNNPLAIVNRTRNNSGGSTGSSISSLESDAPLTPSTPLGLHMTDMQTIANLLSVPNTVQNEQAVKSLASRYKTELCRSYAETGFCKYGDKCQFAHGSTEMKCLPRHPKYKSELCRTFHTSGFCPYGPRCHFIHSEDEGKLTEINLMKQQAAARQATQQMLQQAARLRAQQQALQQQMQALAVSQINLQMVQKQLNPAACPSTTQRPVYYPQMSVPVQTTTATATTNMNAPKPVLDRTISLPTYNMGSVLDTPPITPPCGSPTFDSSNSSGISTPKVVSPPPGFAPKSVEHQQAVSSSCVTLDFSASQPDVIANNINDLVSRLNSMELDSVSSDMYTPSTSPDSMIQSPLDSPRSTSSASRLPVFSKIVS